MENKERSIQDLNRYGIIANYFSENPDRMPQNSAYLLDILDTLLKYSTSMRFGYQVFKEGKGNPSLVNDLCKKINDTLNKNSGIRTGIVI